MKTALSGRNSERKARISSRYESTSTASTSHGFLLCQGQRWCWRVGACGSHGVEDAADEVALEAAERFCLGFAFTALAGHDVLCWLVAAQLRDGDTVEGGIQLAVAAAVQADALDVAA